MSLIRVARNSLRVAGPRRTYSTTSAGTTEGNEWVTKRAAIKEHAKESTDLWRRISFFVCIPATIVAIVWVNKLENEHHEHVEHLKHENGGQLPEVPDYPYLNRRVKPFPWGNNSLFYNPETNKNMDEVQE